MWSRALERVLGCGSQVAIQQERRIHTADDNDGDGDELKVEEGAEVEAYEEEANLEVGLSHQCPHVVHHFVRVRVVIEYLQFPVLAMSSSMSPICDVGESSYARL
jgi:hypothetical protein